MRARIQDFHRRWLRLRLRRGPSRCKRVHRSESFYTSLPPIPLYSLLRLYSSQRRTTLLSYPTLSYPVLYNCRPLHTLVRHRNICRNLHSYLSRHARTLTHCTTWWRAHLSLPLINVCACTRVYNVHEKEIRLCLNWLILSSSLEKRVTFI